MRLLLRSYATAGTVRWLVCSTVMGLTLGLIGCEQPSPPAPPAQNAAPAASTATPTADPSPPGVGVGDYANRALDNSWPALGESAGPLSPDLVRSNYYIVFDGSGSMGDSGCSNSRRKLDVAKEALAEFAQQIPDEVNLGLFVFDTAGTEERIPLASSNRTQVVRAINDVVAGRGTPLSLAIRTGYQSLSRQAMSQLGYGEYHLVVVTDGQASTGYDPRGVVNQMLASSPVVLHTIGFCIKGNHSLNQVGRAYYRQANDPASLRGGLESILAEEPDFRLSDFNG